MFAFIVIVVARAKKTAKKSCVSLIRSSLENEEGMEIIDSMAKPRWDTCPFHAISP